jgi:hypothetical protein
MTLSDRLPRSPHCQAYLRDFSNGFGSCLGRPTTYSALPTSPGCATTTHIREQSFVLTQPTSSVDVRPTTDRRACRTDIRVRDKRIGKWRAAGVRADELSGIHRNIRSSEFGQQSAEHASRQQDSYCRHIGEHTFPVRGVEVFKDLIMLRLKAHRRYDVI